MKAHLEQLALDERLQARATIDRDAVEEYREAYAAGRKLPPVQAFRIAAALYIVDGFHRWLAAHEAGVEFLQVDVVGEGSMDDAVWYATGVNATHGLRRTNADKRRAVTMAVSSPIGAEQSSRVIADHVGVSPDFVSRLRREWEDEQRAAGADVPDTAVDARGARRAKRRVSSDDTGGLSSDDRESVDGSRGGDSRDQSRLPPGAAAGDEPAATSLGGVLAAAGRASSMATVGAALEGVAVAVRRARLDAERAVPADLAAVKREIVDHLERAEAKLRYYVPVQHPACSGAGCKVCSDGYVPAGSLR